MTREEQSAGYQAPWQVRLNRAMDSFYANPAEQTRERFIDILWNEAVLGRVAPADPQEIAARKARGATVWEGNRNDPQLYWHIMYAAAGASQAIEKHWSHFASNRSYIAGIFQTFYDAYSKSILGKIYPEYSRNADRMQQAVVDDIVERARKELEAIGQPTAGHPLKYGMRGTWHDIPVTVDRFNDLGTVWFEADDWSGHNRLFEFARENAGHIMPWEIDTTQFTPAS